MPYFPQPQAVSRPPRVRFAEATPAVLRSKDGRCVPGKLEIVSITGGLLCLAKPLDLGSKVKLLFLTRRGAVFSSAEMLNPVSWSLQPFRFVTLYRDDEKRLRAAIKSSLEWRRETHGWVERVRAW
jgi:hypothetical protein